MLIGIIAAATRPLPQRSRWIAAGIAAGIVGACIVATLAGRLAALFEGAGHELLNVVVLAIAVLMLGYHNIWMSVHGAELATHAKRVAGDVGGGRTALSAVMIVVAMAVLREGSESVLFLYGLTSGGDATLPAVLGGGLAGLAAGALLGILLYAGMLKIPLRWFFGVTANLLLLLAAGMSARMARYLVHADLLPSLASPAWDTSGVLPVDSPIGSVMHALIGYEATPDGIQLVFYAATAAMIATGTWWVRRNQIHVAT